jgi:hypothetical protein
MVACAESETVKSQPASRVLALTVVVRFFKWLRTNWITKKARSVVVKSPPQNIFPVVGNLQGFSVHRFYFALQMSAAEGFCDIPMFMGITLFWGRIYIKRNFTKQNLKQ